MFIKHIYAFITNMNVFTIHTQYMFFITITGFYNRNIIHAFTTHVFIMLLQYMLS